MSHIRRIMVAHQHEVDPGSSEGGDIQDWSMIGAGSDIGCGSCGLGGICYL